MSAKKTAAKKATKTEAAKQKKAEQAAALKAKLDKQNEDAAKKEAERGEKMELARMKGVEIGEAYRDTAVAGIQQIVGKKFVVDATGLQTPDGQIKISEAELVAAVSGLATAGSNLDNVKASVIWVQGDLVNLMSTLPRGEELIEQAIAVSGKDKHTVRQAQRLAAWIPHEKRIASLTATHHMEAFNYSKVTDENGKRVFTDKKIFDVLADAAKGEKIVSVNKANGEEKEIYKPISCAELRKKFQDLCGIKKRDKKVEEAEPTQTEGDEDEGPTGKVSEPEKKNGYLYFSPDFIPFWSEEVSTIHIASGYTCVCMTSMMTIDEDGNEGARVENLVNSPSAEETPEDGPDDDEAPEVPSGDEEEIP